MWNNYPKGNYFSEEKPFLLRFFDQIKFYPVSAEELLQIRKDFPRGTFDIKIEESSFNLKNYRKFLSNNHKEIESFKAKQNKAFETEKNEWIKKGELNFTASEPGPSEDTEIKLAKGVEVIESPLSAVVWKLLVKKGATVENEQPVATLESMKMEFTVNSPKQGSIEEVYVKEGQEVSAGDIIFSLKKQQ